MNVLFHPPFIVLHVQYLHHVPCDLIVKSRKFTSYNDTDVMENVTDVMENVKLCFTTFETSRKNGVVPKTVHDLVRRFRIAEVWRCWDT